MGASAAVCSYRCVNAHCLYRSMVTLLVYLCACLLIYDDYDVVWVSMWLPVRVSV